MSKIREKKSLLGANHVEEIHHISKSAEAKRWERYARGNIQARLIWAGIRFRELMADGMAEEVRRWRGRVYRRYGSEALHLAQAVQSGALVHIKAQLERAGLGEGEIDSFFKRLFEGVDRHIRFIEVDDDSQAEADACHAILAAHAPQVFAIAGSGDARDRVGEVARELDGVVKDYTAARVDEESSATLFYLFRRT